MSQARSLRELIHGLASAPSADPLITGLADDSRRVRRGNLFIALSGSRDDGARYVADALARGAAAVVGRDLPASLSAPVVHVDDPRRFAGLAAARWFGLDGPDAAGFRLLGVTGTNGKTTTAHMTRSILRAAGVRCGLLGTVQYDLCARAVAADMTTPGPIDLAGYLRECIDAGAGAAVMEVSSHALDQQRVAGLRFAAAAFTNLTQDHLDYHKTMEAYGRAKARLFESLEPQAVAVVNRDDPAWQTMVAECRAPVRTFGLTPDADFSASISRNSIAGTLYRMHTDAGDLVLENALVGRHNVYNALAAAALARAIGVAPRAIEEGLAAVRNIPGRLQRVPGIDGIDVFVDYAHTDDALRNVGSVLRPLTRGRLIVVFGCGGDRDRTKRPKMARAAAEFGHAVVVTSDNPRTESPRAIIDEILTGFSADELRRVCIEPDRRAAIRCALAAAEPGDVVLIAGKGHEDYQIVGAERVHFDDVEVAIQAAAELRRAGGQSAA